MFASSTAFGGNGAAVPITAACCSRSEQICCNEAVSAQMPSQRGHSRKFVFPMTTASRPVSQRGQSSVAAAGASVRATAAPQCEQNFAPAKTNPKHEGHATVANRAPQCSQLLASEEAGAPHIGQLSVSAGVVILPPVYAKTPAMPTDMTLHIPPEFVLHRFAPSDDDSPTKRKKNIWA